MNQKMKLKKYLNVLLFGDCDSGKTTLLETLNNEKNKQKQNDEVDSDYDEEEMNDKFNNLQLQITNCYYENENCQIYFKEYCKKQDLLLESSCYEVFCFLFNAKLGMFETEMYQFSAPQFQLTRLNENLKIIFIITHMDDSPEKSTRFQEICRIIQQQIIIKYNLKNASIIPIDSKNNFNIFTYNIDWYEGNTLIDEIQNLESNLNNEILRIKLIVHVKEKPNTIICKVLGGEYKEQEIPDSLFQNFKQNYVQAKSFQDLCCNHVDSFGRNQFLQVEFENDIDIQIGEVFTLNEQQKCYIVQEMIADLQLYQLNQQIITPGSQGELMFFGGIIKFSVTGMEFVMENNQKVKRNFMKSNEFGRIKLQLNQPYCVDKFENYPKMGVFLVLNIEHKIIGEGKIMKVKPI